MKSLLLFIMCCGLMGSCASLRYAHQTTRVERAAFAANLIGTTIEDALLRPLTHETEVKWEGAFWGMGLARYRSENTTRAIHRAFTQWDTLSPSFQRALLEVVYALYPDDFASEAEYVIVSTRHEQLFAIGALHLLRATGWRDVGRISERMHGQFPDLVLHPILRSRKFS